MGYGETDAKRNHDVSNAGGHTYEIVGKKSIDEVACISPQAVRGNLGALALNTIDHALADQICATKELSELHEVKLPFSSRPQGSQPMHLGTWMVWMVHRVALNDPSLTELDFSSYAMPMPEEEKRIAPKLMATLGYNTYLRKLLLEDSNLQGGVLAEVLAKSLTKNHELRVLKIASNFLEPLSLEHLFRALAHNTGLEELQCSNQFSGGAGRDTYRTLAEALSENKVLRKLGMELKDVHWRDQINRRLICNTEDARKRRICSA